MFQIKDAKIIISNNNADQELGFQKKKGQALPEALHHVLNLMFLLFFCRHHCRCPLYPQGVPGLCRHLSSCPSLHHMLFLKHQLLITHAQPPKHWIYQHSPATWPCLCSHPALQNQVPSSAFRCGNPSHKHSLYLQAGLLQVSPQSGLLSPKASSSKNATENTKQETPLILIKLWHDGIFSPRETSSWSYQFQVKAFVMCTSSCTKRQREFKEQQHPQASSPRVP